MNSLVSTTVQSSTGAPQGTVKAPYLFALYTSDYRASHELCPVIKFADDSATVGLINNDDHTHYEREIASFVEYCDRNHLELNVSKTKEMIIDFRRSRTSPTPISIKNCDVQRVNEYKYLGVIIDDKLSWSSQIDKIVTSLKPRLYCLRKMNSFNLRSEILWMLFNSVL